MFVLSSFRPRISISLSLICTLPTELGMECLPCGLMTDRLPTCYHKQVWTRLESQGPRVTEYLRMYVCVFVSHSVRGVKDVSNIPGVFSQGEAACLDLARIRCLSLPVQLQELTAGRDALSCRGTAERLGWRKRRIGKKLNDAGHAFCQTKFIGVKGA